LIFSGAGGPAGPALTSIGVTVSPKPDVEGLTRLIARALEPP
jgi:hypothetical protein